MEEGFLPNANASKKGDILLKQTDKKEETEILGFSASPPDRSFYNSRLIVNITYFYEVQDEFKCPLCGELLYNPRMCGECETIFCLSCISTWKIKNSKCPQKTCSKAQFKIVKINKLGISFYNKLILTCRYGCKVGLIDYPEHSFICENEHKDDISCWNCNNSASKVKLKHQRHENIELIKDGNHDFKDTFLSNYIEEKKYSNELAKLSRLLEKQEFVSDLNASLHQLNIKKNEKEVIKKQIEALEKEFNSGETLSQILEKIEKLTYLKSEYLNQIDALKNTITLSGENLHEYYSPGFKARIFYEHRKTLFKIPTIEETIIPSTSSEIYCITQLSDYQIASGSGDCLIKIWDLSTCKCIQNLRGHNNVVWSIIKLNFDHIVSSSADNTVKIWNFEKKIVISTLVGHSSWVRCLIKLNNTQIISGSDDKSIKIWNIEKSTCVKTLKGHSSYVNTFIKLSENLIASGSYDKSIKIWEITDLNCIKTLDGHNGGVWVMIKISQNKIASGSFDKTIKIWDINNYENSITLNGHTDNVYCLDLISESILVSGSKDQKIKLWDIVEKRCLITLEGHTSNVWSVIKINEIHIVSSSSDNTIRVWDFNKYLV